MDWNEIIMELRKSGVREISLKFDALPPKKVVRCDHTGYRKTKVTVPEKGRS